METLDVNFVSEPSPEAPSKQQPEQQTTEAWFESRGGAVEARNEEPAPSKEPSVPPDSEPGKPSQGKEQGEFHKAEARKEQLNREIRELLEYRDRLKAQPPENGVTRTSPPETAKAPPAADTSKRPERPKEDDFQDWSAFRAAEDKYFEDLADWKADQKLAAHQQKNREAAERMHAEAQAARDAKRYDEQEAEVAKQYPDYKTAADRAEAALRATPNRAVIEFLVNHPTGAKTLYALGKQLETNPNRMAELAAMDRYEVAAELLSLGKGQAPAPPLAKKTTSAPPPPTQLHSGKSAPADEAAEAVASGDFRRYFTVMNARDRKRAS
jgi:hypothetical protein